MASRLETHRDDRIAAVRLEPSRFTHRRRRSYHARPRRPDAVEERLGRQAKMEANNFGRELLYDGARFGIEGFTGGRGKGSFGIQSELEMIGLSNARHASSRS